MQHSLQTSDSRSHFDFDKTYYLSGPMTGLEGFNYEVFERSAADLRDSGIQIVSPHEIEKPGADIPEDLHWQYYMDICRNQCRECQGLIQLPGWAHSRGALQEFDWMKGKPGFVLYFYIPAVMKLIDLNDWRMAHV